MDSVHVFTGAVLPRCPLRPVSVVVLTALFTLVSGRAADLFPIAELTAVCEQGGAAAFDGTNYMVAVQGDTVGSGRATAQLMSLSGRAIGSRISTGRSGSMPDVAFDGTRHLMTWCDDVAGPTSNKVYGQFVTRAGALSGAPFPIGPDYGIVDFESMNSLVFDGANYLVVWQDSSPGGTNGNIYGRWITPAGALPAGAIPVCTVAGQQQSPSLACGRTNCLVVWVGKVSESPVQWAMGGRLVDAAGAMGGLLEISQTNSPGANVISAAFDGTNYLAVWAADVGAGGTNPPVWDIHGRLIGQGGGFSGEEFTISSDAGDQIYPGITFDGSNYLVHWTDRPGTGATVRARFVTTEGRPLGQVFVALPPAESQTPLYGFASFDGHRIVFTGAFGPAFDSVINDVRGRFIPRSGMGAPAFPVATNSASGTMAIGAAFNGTNYLIGIQGDPIAPNRIRAQLMSTTGALVGASAAAGGTGGAPGVASDGGGFLIVWPDDTNTTEFVNDDNIRGRACDSSGAAVGAVASICAAGGRQSFELPQPVVFMGTNYLVVWSDMRSGEEESDIYARFVSPTGGMAASEFAVSSQAGLQKGATIAMGRTSALVVWANRILHLPTYSPWRVEGRFIDPAGAMGPIFTISQTNSIIDNLLGVAFDGTNFMVVWDRDLGSGDEEDPKFWDVGGRIVAPDGSLPGNEFTVAAGLGDQHFATVVFDGAHYLVGWLDTWDMNTRFRFFNPAGQAVGHEFFVFAPDGDRFPLAVVSAADGERVLSLANVIEDFGFTRSSVHAGFIRSSSSASGLSLASGGAPLWVAGVPGQDYVLQATADLRTTNGWVSLMTNHSDSGFIPYFDPGGSTNPTRFYRARRLP